MSSSVIPIRFTLQEKYSIQLLANEMNMPLSTYIKQEFLKLIKPKIAKVNKSTIMFDRLEKIQLPQSDVDKALVASKKFRNDFKVRDNK